MTASIKLATFLALLGISAADLKEGEIGVIDLPEISGAVQLEGVQGSPLLLVGDEEDHINLLKNPAQALSANKADSFKNLASETKLSGEIDDMEDVAWDSASKTAFVLTSHSLTSGGKSKASRQVIAAIPFSEAGKPKVSISPVSNQMETLLRSAAFNGTNIQKSYDRKTPGVGGPNGALNIEGLTFDTSTHELLVGFRSPTEGTSTAYILRIKNPYAIGKSDALKGQIETIALGPDRGIRGMAYDRATGNVWIIAGATHDSADLTVDKWSLYRWKRGSEPVEFNRASLAKRVTGYKKALWNSEAVCILRDGSKSWLLIVSDAGDINGKEGPSPYVLFPLNALTNP